MNHPLTGNLSQLTDTELAAKISELNKRITFGYKTGNTAFLGQAQLLLQDYMTEQRKRTDEHLKKLSENKKDDGTDWDDLIQT